METWQICALHLIKNYLNFFSWLEAECEIRDERSCCLKDGKPLVCVLKMFSSAQSACITGYFCNGENSSVGSNHLTLFHICLFTVEQMHDVYCAESALLCIKGSRITYFTGKPQENTMNALLFGYIRRLPFFVQLCAMYYIHRFKFSPEMERERVREKVPDIVLIYVSYHELQW